MSPSLGGVTATLCLHIAELYIFLSLFPHMSNAMSTVAHSKHAPESLMIVPLLDLEVEVDDRLHTPEHGDAVDWSVAFHRQFITTSTGTRTATMGIAFGNQFKAIANLSIDDIRASCERRGPVFMFHNPPSVELRTDNYAVRAIFASEYNLSFFGALMKRLGITFIERTRPQQEVELRHNNPQYCAQPALSILPPHLYQRTLLQYETNLRDSMSVYRSWIQHQHLEIQAKENVRLSEKRRQTWAILKPQRVQQQVSLKSSSLAVYQNRYPPNPHSHSSEIPKDANLNTIARKNDVVTSEPPGSCELSSILLKKRKLPFSDKYAKK
ncbi:hypothetical protein VHEMI10736 [[Torrubiella] hemipterigena]|uniref:Uncharacterized protein n=1 Tax=[Torrubiella] hemipterigena TaxID=1531966 RepID=A0A0A1TSE6_9HYPO|nr:hypothetical protein VHEMI10736 [[Torrubiella] hemipterigena]